MMTFSRKRCLLSTFCCCLASPLLVSAHYMHMASAFLLQKNDCASSKANGKLFAGREVHSHNPQETGRQEDGFGISRRNSLTRSLVIASEIFASCVVFSGAKPSNAATTNGQDVSAKQKFLDAKKSVEYLADHYDEISKGGGDNVRRYLGTVVTDAPMVGIMKVLKELQKDADDIVEYTENVDAFEYSLRAADTAVYSANFVTFSSAKTKPEEYFANAFQEIKKMRTCMDNMAAELNLK